MSIRHDILISMDMVHAIILGLVEGVSEFLPISSTAHILIVERMLGVTSGQTFEIAIQAGAMLAVIGLYISELRTVMRDLPKLFVAFIPTAVVGYLVYPYLSELYTSFWVIGLVLVIGGIIMILLPSQPISRVDHERRFELTWRQSLWVGCAQSCAVIPGVSRSGGIFIVGELLNIPRRALVRFSFLLGAGTIFAATLYSIMNSTESLDSIISLPFVVAFLVAGISAWLVCKWLLSYMSHASLASFGWYRVILGLILIVFLV